MYHLRSLLFGSLVLSVAAVNPVCRNQPIISLIAAEISSFPEAQSYCSKNFPLSTKTLTSTAPTSTSTVIEIDTLTTTATTTLNKRQFPHIIQITSTSSTATTLITAVSTSSTSLNKWQSVLKAQSAIIGEICTCVENPVTRTVTTTPVATTSVTTKTTTTTIATAPAAIQCTNGEACFGGELFNIQCKTLDTDGNIKSKTSAATYQDCANQCASSFVCQSFFWNGETNSPVCNMYNQVNSGTPPVVPSDEDVYVYGYHLQGQSCFKRS